MVLASECFHSQLRVVADVVEMIRVMNGGADAPASEPLVDHTEH